MKKIIGMLAAMLVCFVCFTSCGGHENSPEGVAIASMKAMKSYDAKDYVKLMDVDESNRANYEQMIESKAFASLKAKDGIDSYEVKEVKEAEDGNSARVKMSVKYGNGEESTQTIRLKKNDEGTWVIKN